MKPWVAVLVVGALLLAGCGSSGATDQELERAYNNGEKTGLHKGEANAVGRVAEARRDSYRAGFRAGEEEAYEIDEEIENEFRQEEKKEEAELESEGREAEEEIPEPEPASPSYNPYEEEYEPEYGAPTTEDFGEGNGYVVECVDGTFSDSGGIQGACSHHGGER